MKRPLLSVLAVCLLVLTACAGGTVNLNPGFSANPGVTNSASPSALASTGPEGINTAAPVGDDSSKQDALLNYINIDLVAVAEAEAEMLTSYDSVSGNNYTSDAAMYTEISTNTIRLCQELNRVALSIQPVDAEIAEVHGIYRNYVAKMLNAFNTMLDALEKQDRSIVNQANDLLAEANDLAVQFQQKLYALAEERDIEFNG